VAHRRRRATSGDKMSFYTPSLGEVVFGGERRAAHSLAVYVQVWSPKNKATISETPTEHVYRWQSSQPLPVAGKKPNDLLRMEKDQPIDDEPSCRLLPGRTSIAGRRLGRGIEGWKVRASRPTTRSAHVSPS